MLSDIRKQYLLSALNEQNVPSDPLGLFEIWLGQAVESEQPEPTAMTLATVDAHLQPHARIVLLKEFSREGFVFFSNYESHKGQQIAQNNRVALIFFWPVLERQVRVEGSVEKISEYLSTMYFKSRPLENQLGAWASPQSQQIHSADFLEQQFEYYLQKFGDEVPKPPHWGGYIVKPVLFEFWQGRANRLHDRLLFVQEGGEWKISRLAP